MARCTGRCRGPISVQEKVNKQSICYILSNIGQYEILDIETRATRGGGDCGDGRHAQRGRRPWQRRPEGHRRLHASEHKRCRGHAAGVAGLPRRGGLAAAERESATVGAARARDGPVEVDGRARIRVVRPRRGRGLRGRRPSVGTRCWPGPRGTAGCRSPGRGSSPPGPAACPRARSRGPTRSSWTPPARACRYTPTSPGWRRPFMRPSGASHPIQATTKTMASPTAT
jgi:hypothetical protein